MRNDGCDPCCGAGTVSKPRRHGSNGTALRNSQRGRGLGTGRGCVPSFDIPHLSIPRSQPEQPLHALEAKSVRKRLRRRRIHRVELGPRWRSDDNRVLWLCARRVRCLHRELANLVKTKLSFFRRQTPAKGVSVLGNDHHSIPQRKGNVLPSAQQHKSKNAREGKKNKYEPYHKIGRGTGGRPAPKQDECEPDGANHEQPAERSFDRRCRCNELPLKVWAHGHLRRLYPVVAEHHCPQKTKCPPAL